MLYESGVIRSDLDGSGLVGAGSPKEKTKQVKPSRPFSKISIKICLGCKGCMRFSLFRLLRLLSRLGRLVSDRTRSTLQGVGGYIHIYIYIYTCI